MKKLIVIRHAKSCWDNPDLPDHDRPLNHRGKKDAPRMAKRLKEKRIFPDVMISSTATRARDTCEAMATVLGFTKEKIITDPKIYHASVGELFAIVRGWKNLPDEEEVVLLFGHNPGLTEFVNQLTSERIANVPTTGVAAIEMKIKNWNEARAGCGKLLFFDFPKNNDH